MLAPLLLFLLLAVVPVLSTYAPLPAICPKTSLVRAATGLSDEEETYRVARKAVADAALKTWLISTNSVFGTAELPTLALTTSGGSYRSLLSGAGVVQGFDKRDSSVSTSGIYQALTYQGGLSGGSWLLSSMAGNNWPTITSLKNSLWLQAFQDSLLDPSFLLVAEAYGEVLVDILEKEAAGFRTTLTDPWGRLLSYQLLSGSDGGASNKTLSSLASLSNFTSYAVPFPIITALGTKVWEGECVPGPNATTYEFTPYDFGSWDSDISAFTPTKYLGTSMSGGKPTGLCTKNYDNLGYIFGTSSSLFNNVCFDVPLPENSTTDLEQDLAVFIDKAHELGTEDLYATYRNPFYNYLSPTATPNVANNISAQENLSLVDGGEALQNNPIFPFLQPARNVSVIIVNDNSNDVGGFPNGSEILTTYVQFFNHGLTRMPFIPSVETFIAEGLNKRATFFGCNATDKITIVYLPNDNFTFASNTSTYQLEYPKPETEAMIANGVEIATQGSDTCWGTCLGCALMMNTGQALPSECTACFTKHCYYP